MNVLGVFHLSMQDIHESACDYKRWWSAATRLHTQIGMIIMACELRILTACGYNGGNKNIREEEYSQPNHKEGYELIMKNLYAPEKVSLVYLAEDGTEYTQPVTDVVEVGSLVDPDTGEDMEIIRVEVEI